MISNFVKKVQILFFCFCLKLAFDYFYLCNKFVAFNYKNVLFMKCDFMSSYVFRWDVSFRYDFGGF